MSSNLGIHIVLVRRKAELARQVEPGQTIRLYNGEVLAVK